MAKPTRFGAAAIIAVLGFKRRTRPVVSAIPVPKALNATLVGASCLVAGIGASVACDRAVGFLASVSNRCATWVPLRVEIAVVIKLIPPLKVVLATARVYQTLGIIRRVRIVTHIIAQTF